MVPIEDIEFGGQTGLEQRTNHLRQFVLPETGLAMNRFIVSLINIFH